MLNILNRFKNITLFWWCYTALLLPFNFFTVPKLGYLVNDKITWLINKLNSLFKISESTIEFSSGEDHPTILYFLLITLVLALLTYLILIAFKSETTKLTSVLKVICNYYLALMLCIYGFDKLYLFQFYPPEPNIEYTYLKDLNIDLLYWSTMGKSVTLSVVSGIIEVLAGIGLLFRKMHKLAWLLALVALSNVVLMNFSFDITVKFFSVFLWIGLWLSAGNTGVNLLRHLLDKPLLNSESTPIIRLYNKKRIWIHGLLVMWILLESNYKMVYFHFISPDKLEVPAFYGAYMVDSSSIDQQKIPFEKIFIHKDHYIIFEDKQGIKTDFSFKNTEKNNVIQLNFGDRKVYYEFLQGDKTWKLKIYGDSIKLINLDLIKLI